MFLVLAWNSCPEAKPGTELFIKLRFNLAVFENSERFSCDDVLCSSVYIELQCYCIGGDCVCSSYYNGAATDVQVTKLQLTNLQQYKSATRLIWNNTNLQQDLSSVMNNKLQIFEVTGEEVADEKKLRMRKSCSWIVTDEKSYGWEEIADYWIADLWVTGLSLARL